jgi:ZIP family zinc transporter
MTATAFESIIAVFLVSLTAGLATGLGGLIALVKKPGRRSLGLMMGYTAGVMLTLAFTGLIGEAWLLSGYLTTSIGFALGALSMFAIDYFIPHIRFGKLEANKTQSKLIRTGMLIAIGITIHNLPEGIAVGAGFMHLPKFGLFIALAIALHNIPEGIAIALPLCKGGTCKKDSIKIALLSGLAEPVGALLAALFLSGNSSLIPLSLAFAAGVMTFITLDELIPTAREHGHEHYTALGIIAGTISVFVLSGLFGI